VKRAAMASLVVVFAAACGGSSDEPACAQCSAAVASEADAAVDAEGAAPAPDAAEGAAPAPDAAESSAPAAPADAADVGAPPLLADAASADAGWPVSCSGTVSGVVAKDLVAKGAVLVDVRTAAEYAAGHVAGAINIPVTALSTRLGEIDIGTPVVVYCQSGGRAAQAALTLCGAGYEVYNLGPMSNWPG
jgi:phage shock protein E